MQYNIIGYGRVLNTHEIIVISNARKAIKNKQIIQIKQNTRFDDYIILRKTNCLQFDCI